MKICEKKNSMWANVFQWSKCIKNHVLRNMVLCFSDTLEGWLCFLITDIRLSYRLPAILDRCPGVKLWMVCVPCVCCGWSAAQASRYETVPDQPQWTHSRPTTDCRHQSWAIIVLSELCSICEQPLYGIIVMILHIHKICTQILPPFQKFTLLRDTRVALSFPVEHARPASIDPHWTRTCCMVMGQRLQPRRIPYMARVTQHLLICGKHVTKIWSTDLYCAEA